MRLGELGGAEGRGVGGGVIAVSLQTLPSVSGFRHPPHLILGAALPGNPAL